jgi:hypothetical protein
MRAEPVIEKIVLSKEDYQYYQLRKKECKVYDPNYREFRFTSNNKHYKKRY